MGEADVLSDSAVTNDDTFDRLHYLEEVLGDWREKQRLR